MSHSCKETIFTVFKTRIKLQPTIIWQKLHFLHNHKKKNWTPSLTLHTFRHRKTFHQIAGVKSDGHS